MYRRCGLTVPSEYAEPVLFGPSPSGLIIENYQGTTAVMRAGRWTWACNLEPARAASLNGKQIEERLNSNTFQVDIKPFPPRSGLTLMPHVLIWGGGLLPPGYEWITFVLPNGVQVPAVTKNGYWAVQTITPEWGSRTKPIRVLLNGPHVPKSLEIRLRWMTMVDRWIAG